MDESWSDMFFCQSLIESFCLFYAFLYWSCWTHAIEIKCGNCQRNWTANNVPAANPKLSVAATHPNKNGIAPEDEITQINGKKIEKKIADVLKNCKKKITFTIKKKFSEKPIILAIGNYYKLLELVKKEATTEQKLILRKVWCNN